MKHTLFKFAHWAPDGCPVFSGSGALLYTGHDAYTSKRTWRDPFGQLVEGVRKRCLDEAFEVWRHSYQTTQPARTKSNRPRTVHPR